MDLKQKIKDKFVKESESAEKAWSFFKQILNDEEKYVAFKDKLKPIEVKGNEGGVYFLYPTGTIARIDEKSPMIGNIYFTDAIHKVDFLSTVLLWIKHNEDELKQVWGCGNLSVLYNGSRNMRDVNEPLRYRPMREDVQLTGWHPVLSGQYFDVYNGGSITFPIIRTFSVAGT